MHFSVISVWESSGQFSKRAKKTQKRYACRAQHTSTTNPTHINEKLKFPPKTNHIFQNDDANNISQNQVKLFWLVVEEHDDSVDIRTLHCRSNVVNSLS